MKRRDWAGILWQTDNGLNITYSVNGTLGTSTGKRLLMPADLFMAGASATFLHEKREQAVYFDYPQTTQDAVRLNFKKGISVEAAPAADKFKFQDRDAYDMTVTSDETSFTMRRSHLHGDFLIPLKDYPALRQYYSQFESKDKENVVLKVMPTETAMSPDAK
jgi:hypothetical protein